MTITAAQKAKIMEMEYEKVSRLEELAEETELGLDACKYHQQFNASRIQFYTQHQLSPQTTWIK